MLRNVGKQSREPAELHLLLVAISERTDIQTCMVANRKLFPRTDSVSFFGTEGPRIEEIVR